MFIYIFQKPLPSWILIKTIAKSERFGDGFQTQTLTLSIVSTNRQNIIQRFHTAGVSPCTCGQVTSGHVVGVDVCFSFSQRTNSRCSCDRSFLRCMLPLNQRDLLTESFPLIHVQHGGLGASAWTVSGTEISRPFATPFPRGFRPPTTESIVD